MDDFFQPTTSFAGCRLTLRVISGLKTRRGGDSCSAPPRPTPMQPQATALYKSGQESLMKICTIYPSTFFLPLSHLHPLMSLFIFPQVFHPTFFCVTGWAVLTS